MGGGEPTGHEETGKEQVQGHSDQHFTLAAAPGVTSHPRHRTIPCAVPLQEPLTRGAHTPEPGHLGGPDSELPGRTKLG